MSTMELLDLMLRGGVLALSALVVYQLLSIRPFCAGAVIGAAFILSGASYTLSAMPQAHDLFGAANLALKFGGFLAVNLFLMFAMVLSSDAYRPGRMELGLAAISSMQFLFLCVFTAHPFMVEVRAAHILFSLALVAWAMRVTWLALKDDLVESRRGLSQAMLFIMPATGAIILFVTAMETMNWPERPFPLFQSGMIFLTLAAFAVTVGAVREELFAPNVPAGEKTAAAMQPADRFELRRLQGLMEDGAFLESGLTIGGLARRLDMPEHRLRKLINNQLGYRNFAAFINDHRIDEAKRRLGNASLAREQITGMAFDLGFSSLAPFNRAFRERVGMSPSEFRTRALSAILETADNHLPS